MGDGGTGTLFKCGRGQYWLLGPKNLEAAESRLLVLLKMVLPTALPLPPNHELPAVSVFKGKTSELKTICLMSPWVLLDKETETLLCSQPVFVTVHVAVVEKVWGRHCDLGSQKWA